MTSRILAIPAALALVALHGVATTHVGHGPTTSTPTKSRPGDSLTTLGDVGCQAAANKVRDGANSHDVGLVRDEDRLDRMKGCRRQPPPTASRSRPTPAPTESIRLTITPGWAALFACESSGNPRAVSPDGLYRGLAQMDADFWRTYGGLAFAPRPDLASAADQLVVAQRGYAARGASPWPYCGRFL